MVNPSCLRPHRAAAVRDLEKRPDEFKPYYETLLPENLSTHCHELLVEKANAKRQKLIKANNKLHEHSRLSHNGPV